MIGERIGFKSKFIRDMWGFIAFEQNEGHGWQIAKREYQGWGILAKGWPRTY